MEALYAVILADDPLWYSYPDEHFTTTLTALPASVVVNAARHLPSGFATKKRSRPHAIAALVSHLFSLRSQLVPLSDEDLFALCLPFLKSPSDTASCLTVICSYFISHYGEIVAAAFRHPPNMLADPTDLNVSNPNLELEPPNLKPLNLEPPDFDVNVTIGRGGCPLWLSLPASELTRHLERLSRTEIVDCIRGLPLLQRPVYRDLSRRKCCALLLQHIDRRASYLASLDDDSFLVAALGVLPFAIPASRDCMTDEVLHAEYSSLVVDRLCLSIPTKLERQKVARRTDKELLAAQAREDYADVVDRWPSVVPQNVALQCVDDYVLATQWDAGVVCAVCSRQTRSATESVLAFTEDADELPNNLELLCSADPFIVHACPQLQGGCALEHHTEVSTFTR